MKKKLSEVIYNHTNIDYCIINYFINAMNVNISQLNDYPKNGEDYKNSHNLKFEDMLNCRKNFEKAKSAFCDSLFLVNLNPKCDIIILEIRDLYLKTYSASSNAINAYYKKNAVQFEDYYTATTIFSALTVDAVNRAEDVISFDIEERYEMYILKKFETVL